MDRRTLLELIARLGREFQRREMRGHALRMRGYYLLVRSGLTEGRHKIELRMDEEFVVEWFRVLNLEPFSGAYEKRPPGSLCDRCPPGVGAVYTVIVFPGGAKQKCGVCGRAWLEGEADSTST